MLQRVEAAVVNVVKTSAEDKAVVEVPHTTTTTTSSSLRTRSALWASAGHNNNSPIPCCCGVCSLPPARWPSSAVAYQTHR